MEIDNDYLGYRTPGLNGLRVTCAHEFFHAIQIGSYGIWRTATKSDFYFYELSSTWMEDVVYDDVNDYLYEIRDYLTTSSGRGFRDLQGRALPFTTYGSPWGYYGYERALFAHFLEARFGRPVIQEIWSWMKTQPFMNSIESALESRGSSFAYEFATFGFWNYYTADRADSLRYYPEGGSYPRLDPNIRLPYNGYFATVSTMGAPLSDQHFEFVGQADTIHAAVLNVNVAGAAVASPVSASLGLTASSAEQGGIHQKLANGVQMSLSVDQSENWRELYVLASTASDARASGAPSPNPLSLKDCPMLTIPLEGSTASTALVSILSVSMDLVFSREFPIIEQFGRPVVVVPSQELQSSVSTGVHFLVVRAGETDALWKIAIVR